MNEVNPSVALANSTLLNLRKMLVNMRTGKGVSSMELELMVSRSITDLAGLLDYVDLLETQRRGPDEKDRGVQPMG